MCDVRIKVTAGIGQGGIYKCQREHVAQKEHSYLPPLVHEVYLGAGGAVLRWDDAGWHWPKKSTFEVVRDAQ